MGSSKERCWLYDVASGGESGTRWATSKSAALRRLRREGLRGKIHVRPHPTDRTFAAVKEEARQEAEAIKAATVTKAFDLAGITR